MSSELIKIKEYTIPKFCMNIESISKEEFEIELSMALNIMIPKDTEKEECIVEVRIEYADKEKKPVVSALLRGRVDVDTSLEEDEKKDALKKDAAPVFYNVLRKFIGEMSEKTNIEFPNIPPIEDVSF